MSPYTLIPDPKTLRKAVPVASSLEQRVKATQVEKLSDLKGIVKSLGHDLQQRTILYGRILSKLEESIVRIDNEILQGEKGREGDLTRVAIEKLKEQQRAFKDIIHIKGQIRHYALAYKDLGRAVSLLPSSYLNRQLIEDLKPVIGLPADLLKLNYDFKTQETILLQPPAPDQCAGEFSLGQVMYDDKELEREFGLSREDFTKHILVCGESGSGKTTFIRHMLKQLIGKVPFCVFDFKRDYRGLAQHPEVEVIRWEQLSFNPLRPPGPLIEWLQNFSDALSQDSALMIGSRGFLLEQLVSVVRQFKDGLPSLRDLLTLLNTLKISGFYREASYLSVVKNRLRTLWIQLPQTVGCREGFPLESLLGKNVILELDGLGIEAQNFLVTTILSWVYLYRMARHQRGKLRHVLVLDEAKRIFDRNKELRPAEGVPQIDILTSRVREFGEALLVSDQEPVALTNSIKANSYTKVCLRLGNGRDIEDFARAMSLNRRDFISKLKTGQAIVRVDGLNPFLVQIPFLKREADFTPKTSFQPVSNPISPISPPDKLSIVDRAFLLDIASSPLASVTQRYQRLKTNPREGNQRKRTLLEQGYIKEVSVVDGRKILFLELTPKGALSLGRNPRRSWREGGIEHQYWRGKAAQHYLKEGYKVEEEVSVGEGKKLDVVVEKQGKKIAIQIETGKSDIAQNVESCLAAGYSKIILIPTNQKAKVKVKETASEFYPTPVFVKLPQTLK